jgi:DNA (cytosine-5)-methyltransferase 1
LALFSGAGGGILGGTLLGWRTVCAVEIDAYCRRILLSRQRDGILKPFPIWDDVRTFDGRPWRGSVDVISGGFPCQDISCAGKGEGINGARSGLWGEFARIIGEVRPRYVFVENVSALLVRGMGRVLGDLAEMGYDAEWGVLGARDVGAPHRRERIWIVADADGEGLEGRDGGVVRERAGELFARQSGSREMEHTNGTGCEHAQEGDARESQQGEGQRDGGTAAGAGWWEFEPCVGRVANGVAHRVERLRALGNGQVPGVAALAWRMLVGGG